jgi:hypothetical protein
MRITMGITMLCFFVQGVQHPDHWLKTRCFMLLENPIELLDLMYFWSIDSIQPKVAIQANKIRHSTMRMRMWLNKLCIFSWKMIKQ